MVLTQSSAAWRQETRGTDARASRGPTPREKADPMCCVLCPAFRSQASGGDLPDDGTAPWLPRQLHHRAVLGTGTTGSSGSIWNRCETEKGPSTMLQSWDSATRPLTKRNSIALYHSGQPLTEVPWDWWRSAAG